jgi:hypothetical protein
MQALARMAVLLALPIHSALAVDRVRVGELVW